jgi:hypothetical protein
MKSKEKAGEDLEAPINKIITNFAPMKICIEEKEERRDASETVEIIIRRQQLTEVFVPAPDGTFFKGQKLREDGNRVTVRFDKPDAPKGFIVKTVFRETFEQWQQQATQK